MAKDISLLDRLTIPEPCPASWEAMNGDSAKRFCDQCGKHVHNLSAMTRSEAERVLEEHSSDLCGRIMRKADGRIITRWEPKSPERWPRWARALAAAAMWGITLVSGGCWGAGYMRPLGGSVRIDRNNGTAAADQSADSPDCGPTDPSATTPAGSTDGESNPVAPRDVTKP